MKQYSYLVNRQFQVNKRRGLFTLMGIILGIVLFTTVNYLSYFMEDLNIAKAKHLNGNYHAVMKKLTDNQVNALKYNSKVEECGFYNLENVSKIEVKGQLKSLYVYGLDENSINSLFSDAMELVEGRVPKEAGEIIVSSEAKHELSKVIGQEVEVENKKYTIVGFFQGRKEHPSEIQSITLFDKTMNNTEINGVIRVKDKRNIYNEVNEITMDIGLSNSREDDQVSYNNNLLYYLGEESYEINGIANNQGIVLMLTNIVILLLTIILTYGSINVSMKERVQQFSLLRCIGASSDKIRFLLIKEGVMLGVLAIIPGVFIGHIIISIIIKVVLQQLINMNLYGVPLTIYWRVIVEGVILTFIIIFTSSIIPVIQSGKIAPLVGVIKGGEQIKRVKKYKYNLVKKIFGYEGGVAYKNIRGNSKSFWLTTIMLASLLIVFVVITGFYSVIMGNMFRKLEGSKENVQIQYYISSNGDTDNIEHDKVKNNLMGIETYKNELENTGVLRDFKSNIVVSASMLFQGVASNGILENENVFNFNGIEYSYSRYGTINIYDDSALDRIIPYIDGQEVKREDFNENGVVIINPIVKTSLFKKEIKEIFKTTSNEDITIYLEKIQEDSLYNNLTNEGLLNTVKNSFEINGKIIGTIDYLNVIDKERYINPWGLNIIVSQEFYNNNKSIFASKQYNGGTVLLNFNYKNEYKNEDNIEIIKKLANGYGGIYYDYEEEVKDDARDIKGVAVIIYTILFLAMAIGVLNILNNKILNMELRKKEFGTMLALGMKKEKLRKVLIMEGILQWLISSIIGSCVSYVVLKIIYVVYEYIEVVDIGPMPIWSIIVAVIGLLTINLISSFIQLRKVNEMAITELIREKE